jgi:hypothetical protein
MLTILSSRMSVTVLLIASIVSIHTSVLADCSSQNAENNNSPAARNIESSAVAASTSFVLPSGNIYCALVGANQDALRCEIRSMLNPIPPQPNSCEFDWGAGFLLSQNGKPEILCISDTIGGSDYTLSYGSTWKNAGFKCESQTIGLTCKNSTGQGFFLSREKWNVF